MHEVSAMLVSTPATGRITNWIPGGSSLYHSPERPLQSFGPSTQHALQALGYGDVFDNVITENWVSELAKRGLTNPDHAEQISAAIVSLMVWSKSLTLSGVIFHRLSNAKKWHNKTSAWSAYLHFKGQSSNEDKAVGQQSNICSLAHDAEEYHKLTLEQLSEMVDKFNKIKSSGQSKPPNVTTCTCLAKVNHSFAAMVSEAEALKERVGTETLIVAV
ncbi:hypothetical protein BDR04DRAFT_1119392 [Suillus decipiens]|nr:hypothetical protein BDR04DRAFT_1119392 [Suillus decipiens]